MIYVILGITLLWAIVSAIRVELVHHHVERRIKEVYASKNWYKYIIDIEGAYTLALWDYRKWVYRDYFPEEVV